MEKIPHKITNHPIKRRKTRPIKVGNIIIGGDALISVQSMTKTDTRDIGATVSQIRSLEKTGCEIIRVAVPDIKAAKCLGKIKKQINIPLVADIHFDYKLALEAIKQGVDKLRLNPGNISSQKHLSLIISAAAEKDIAIRIGVNAGSIKKNPKSEIRNPKLMVDECVKYLKIFEKHKFYNIIISLKSSDVLSTVEAYRQMAGKCDYPFHLGITEAGPLPEGLIKSSVGLGILLSEGIGDTIRVSLTAPPEEEVKAGFQILQSIKLREYGPEIISCPTCGRCKIDVIKIVTKLKKQLSSISSTLSPIKIAVMGCEVNGPGEAKEADIGIAGGKTSGILFCKGKIVKRVKKEKLVQELISGIRKLL
ncbi:flavodoxin-dependent (E)-4-hydroxy-3-methylbut-2-enyl-diphosphate synthase [bacterium]|nr:flavodoxin-dependent (E)-4-hydroxy-3-methylbut-2-enyl-diphosphate synthase [bacterium]